MKLAREAAEADEAKFRQEEEKAILRERRLTAEAELKVLQARQKAEALGLAPPLLTPPSAGPPAGCVSRLATAPSLLSFFLFLASLTSLENTDFFDIELAFSIPAATEVCKIF